MSSQNGNLSGPRDTWGFPKIRGTILGLLVIRTIVYWGLLGSPYPALGLMDTLGSSLEIMLGKFRGKVLFERPSLFPISRMIRESGACHFWLVHLHGY